MLLRIKLLTLNIAGTLLLIFFLCLGSQNLEKRYNLNLLINKTVELPIGFLVGISFSLGMLTGGLTSTLMIKDEIKDEI